MSRRVTQVSRLLFKEGRGADKRSCRALLPGMVKRGATAIAHSGPDAADALHATGKKIRSCDTTVGSATMSGALGDTRKSIKNNGAWRYPGGIIQRLESTTINGRPDYFDHKDPGEPRRKQESNFFITLNTNRSCAAGGKLAEIGKESMKRALTDMAKETTMCSYIKFGPKNKEYENDRFEDVIKKIEWNAAVELGENLKRLHCHIWLTVHHYSQVQINMPMMQHVFKQTYNMKLVNYHADGAPNVFTDDLRCRGMPYIQVKLLPESNWAEVMKQYIHKAMQEHTS